LTVLVAQTLLSVLFRSQIALSSTAALGLSVYVKIPSEELPKNEIRRSPFSRLQLRRRRLPRRRLRPPSARRIHLAPVRRSRLLRRHHPPRRLRLRRLPP